MNAVNKEYYQDIFKRKSFHLFRNVGPGRIEKAELDGIVTAFDSFERLYPEIRTAVRIVPAEKVNFKRDAEYCILIYSEKKDNYLMNAGYVGEQLDLYLVHHNIGTLWYGIGKADIRSYDGLDFVIMIAIHKVNDPSLFRKDMFKAKRRPVEELWSGDTLGLAEIARFSPSACNTQPWYVKNENGTITVFRYKKNGRHGIMPAGSVAYYNRIDTGIFLCILELCMAEKGTAYSRELYIDTGDEEYTRVAVYSISR